VEDAWIFLKSRENNVWDDGGLSDEECGNVVVSPAVLLRG